MERMRGPAVSHDIVHVALSRVNDDDHPRRMVLARDQPVVMQEAEYASYAWPVTLAVNVIIPTRACGCQGTAFRDTGSDPILGRASRLRIGMRKRRRRAGHSPRCIARLL